MARGSYVAGGNILPYSFVKLSTTATGQVLQAGSGDNVFGVSMPGTRNAPFPGLDDGYAAIAGENIRVFTAEDPADECYLKVDAAYNPGQLLKPGTNGIGTATTADKDIAGAIVMAASSAANQTIRVRVIAPYNVSI
jgi:hypothetical protein